MNCFTVMFVQMTGVILMKIKRPLSRLLDIQLYNYFVRAHWHIHHNLVFTNKKNNFVERRRSDQWLPHCITFKRNSLRIFRVCVLSDLVFCSVLFFFHHWSLYQDDIVEYACILDIQYIFSVQSSFHSVFAFIPHKFSRSVFG